MLRIVPDTVHEIKMMVVTVEGLRGEAFAFHVSEMAAFCAKHCPLWGSDVSASEGKVNPRCLCHMDEHMFGRRHRPGSHPSVDPLLLLPRPPGSFTERGAQPSHHHHCVVLGQSLIPQVTSPASSPLSVGPHITGPLRGSRGVAMVHESREL